MADRDLDPSRSARPPLARRGVASERETRSYAIGRFILRPYRELLRDGVPISLGRKPLALLSTLAQAEGDLVTKDELAAAGWPKAMVDDNALQVHVTALRKLLGEDAALLTTARGLGYRLRVSEPTPLPPPDPKALPLDPEQPLADRPAKVLQWPATMWRRLLAASAVVSVIAAAAWWSQRGGGDAEGLTALSPFRPQGADPGLQALSNGLGETISSALSSSSAEVASAPEDRSAPRWAAWSRPNAEFRIGGAVWRDGGAYHVHAHLDDARENIVLWSDDFSGAVSARGSLEASVAARAADAALWARLGRSSRTKVNPVALAAFIAGRESLTGVRADEAALVRYEKVVAAAPDFSWGHSAIAATQGFALLKQPASAKTDADRAAARAQADRALQLDPRNGEAYLALELLTSRTDWSRREALLLKGAAANPEFEPVAMMEGRLLWGAGRTSEATPWLQLAHDIDPFHNGATWSLALNQASLGRAAQSRALLAQMAQQWPEHSATKDARFWTSLVTGDYQGATALLRDEANWPSDVDQGSVAIWRAVLRAAVGANASRHTAIARRIIAAAGVGVLSREVATTLLTELGDLDDAFVQARLYRPPDPFAPPYLFLPTTAALRADKRFMTVARDLGLVAYWRASGHWPDFCRDPGFAYDCRAEAEKLKPFPNGA